MHAKDGYATFRLRRFWRKNAGPGKYTGSCELLDEHSGQRMAVCDLAGSPALHPVGIADSRGQFWSMEPNRRVMPSRWILTDPAGDAAAQFEQRILAKLVNLSYRVVLTLLDGDGNERYRLVDPRGSLLDQLFIGPNEWALLSGETAVAKLLRLPVDAVPAKGLLGKLKNLLQSPEEGFVSAGREHLLPASVVMGMLLLVKELTDPSASG